MGTKTITITWSEFRDAIDGDSARFTTVGGRKLVDVDDHGEASYEVVLCDSNKDRHYLGYYEVHHQYGRNPSEANDFELTEVEARQVTAIEWVPVDEASMSDSKRGDLTIRYAQHNQPWTVPYSAELEASRRAMPHLYGSHVTLHAMKSLGKVATVFEKLDHTGAAELDEHQLAVIRSMSADLMTTALRLANLYGFELDSALCERVEEKNGVSL